MTKREKEKRKKRRRKLFLAILMLLFTGVVLTASTYAWFTANKTVTVDTINVNVAASNGLQISTDAINWKTIISNDDITSAIVTYPAAKNQLPKSGASLLPVSTIGDIDSSTGYMKMYKGTIETGSDDVDNANILTAVASTETNTTESGDFVAFDVFFQVTTETPIYLTSNSDVTAAGDAATGIQNAARVGFIVEGNGEPGTVTSTLQGLKTDSASNLTIWEPNADSHTNSGLTNASDIYGITSITTPIPYKGVKAPIALADDVILSTRLYDSLDESNDYYTDFASYFDSVQGTYFFTNHSTEGNPAIPTSEYKSFVTLQPGVTKVRIYMWVEGQDVDCENNASGGSIDFDLQFSSLSSAS